MLRNQLWWNYSQLVSVPAHVCHHRQCQAHSSGCGSLDNFATLPMSGSLQFCIQECSLLKCLHASTTVFAFYWLILLPLNYKRPPSLSPPVPATPEPVTPPKWDIPSSDVSGASADSLMAQLLNLKAKMVFCHNEASPHAKQPSTTWLTMLKTIHQKPEQGWVLLEQGVHGYDLPEWFEKQVCLCPSCYKPFLLV